MQEFEFAVAVKDRMKIVGEDRIRASEQIFYAFVDFIGSNTPYGHVETADYLGVTPVTYMRLLRDAPVIAKDLTWQERREIDMPRFMSSVVESAGRSADAIINRQEMDLETMRLPSSEPSENPRDIGYYLPPSPHTPKP